MTASPRDKSELAQRIIDHRFSAAEIADRVKAIHEAVRRRSARMVVPDFTHAADSDLALLEDLAWNLFAHTQTRHDLVTQNERARTLVGVRVGDLVRFTFEGRPYTGRINRITRRATVLVEDPTGQPFGDGKRYLKFYLPLPMLEKVEP